MTILGVDPGVDGALACLAENGDLVAVVDMPVIAVKGKRRVVPATLAAIVRDWSPRLAVIEEVGARPGDGVTGMFNFGYGAGVLEGVCAALDIPVVFERPDAWKRAMKVTANKGSSRLMAQRLWPKHAANFLRVKDDGRAEAALIGFHGRARWMWEVA